MNTIIHADLTTLEDRLNALLDSINSYNPSPSAATAFQQADDRLSRSLETLSRHQRNHAELVSLRDTAAALDERIKQIMRSLAESRKMLKGLAPPSSGPRAFSNRDAKLGVGYDGVAVAEGMDGDRKVDAKELLAYAQRLARYTVPPAHRRDLPPPSSGPPGVEPGGPPTPAETGDQQAPTNAGNEGRSPGREEEANANERTMAKLPLDKQMWLSPDTENGGAPPFMPFPSEEHIKRGALANIQLALSQGRDPAVEDLTARTDGSGGDGDGAQEDGKGDADTGVNDDAYAGNISAVGLTREEALKKREEQEKMFGGFDLYDPDED